MKYIVDMLLESETDCLSKAEAASEVQLCFPDVTVLTGEDEDLFRKVCGINLTHLPNVLSLKLEFPTVIDVAFYAIELAPGAQKPKLLQMIPAREDQRNYGFYKFWHAGAATESAKAEAPRFWNELKRVLVKPAAVKPFDPFDL